MSRQNGIRVLIVEDEQLIALQMRIELEDAGYDVMEPAADSDQALERVDALLPDVIFMDVHLSGNLDGIETARTIRKRHAVPIVFLTGYIQPETMEQVKEIGETSVLCKPVFLHQLEEAIRQAVGDRPAGS